MVNNKNEHDLWRLADHQRQDGMLDLVALIQEGKAAGIDIGISELRFLAQKMPKTHMQPIAPDWLTDFIVEYLKGRIINSMLDPCAESMLLIPLGQKIQTSTALGYIRSSEPFEIATLLDSGRIKWKLGTLNDMSSQLKNDIDLVVSCPPFGSHPVSASLAVGNATVIIKDIQEYMWLLESSIHLKPHGTAIFIVPNGFFFRHQPYSVYANLEKFGLVIDAALSVPAGTFAPYTSIPTTLIFLRRAEQSSFFVGELSVDRKHNAVLLKNLKARKAGPELSLGAFVDRNQFRSYQTLVTQDKIQGLTRSLGIKPIELIEIVSEVNFTRAIEYPGFPERPNAIYLPLIVRGDVVTTLSQATFKRPSSYAQLVLNPNKAVDLYVAGFFNTDLGRLIREQMMLGISMPKVQSNLIAQAHIYLPDLETQLRTIEANSKITDLVSELRDLQVRTWSQPLHLKEVLRKIDTVNQVESFSNWLDTLPFPLASILWVYRAAEIDYKRAFEHLLHFFEALAQFLATILLSGFATDEGLFQAKLKQLQNILPEDAFERSTFGVWVRIVEYLAKDGRTMLNSNEESQNRYKAMFRTLDREILDVLFSRKIIPILQKTNELRNEWTGHGGVVNQRDAQGRHTILANYLSELRSVFGTGWKNYELIRAGANRYFEGIYHYDVERLVGCREPFEERKIKVDVPMDYGQLYFLSTGEKKPLRLLPLIRVIASPKTDQDACYFYNRVQRDGIRFVSYHFNAESEVVASFKDTHNTLRFLSSPVKVEN